MSNESSRVHRYDYDVGPFIEELGHKKEEVDLSRAESGSVNFLKDHGSFWSAGIEDVLGRVYDVSLTGEKLEGSVQFATRDEVQGLVKDIKAGIIKNVSIGYKVKKFQKVGEEEGTPVLRATDWELLEVSAVAIPADPGAQMRGEIPRKNKEGLDRETFECLIDENYNGDRTMSLSVKKDLVENKASDVEAAEKAREEGIKAERSRVESISRSVKAAGLSSQYAQTLIGEGVSVDKAREVIFKELETKSRNAHTDAVHVQVNGQDERRARIEGAANALLHRSNPGRYKLEANGRPYAGASLLRLAEHFVGPSALGMTKEEICHRALSTSDFPELLANVASKTLLDAYDLAPQTFRPWIREGTLPDFKEASRVRFGDMPPLAKVDEGAEYTFGPIGESAEKIKLLKYGRALKITWETIINDSGGEAFGRIPTMMGTAARRLESKLVYDVLTSNPALSDGVPLFHADHGNTVGSGTKIGEASLSVMRAAMRKQKSLDGVDFLDIFPAYIIVGPDRETDARKILAGEVLGSTEPSLNVFRGSSELIVEPRVPGNAWFAAASPNTVDTVEVATLDGQRGLQIVTDESGGGNGDYVEMKIRHVIGVKPIDYRGLYYNPGA